MELIVKDQDGDGGDGGDVEMWRCRGVEVVEVVVMTGEGWS